MKKLGLLTALIFMTAGTAQASCYMPKEAEAEQGIRIHSELMVIGLNCQHKPGPNGENLYVEYRAFTDENVRLFAAYEKILMNYYKKQGASDPEARLDALRTDFANKISNDAATMRPDMFCNRYAPRISRASTMDYADIRKWAATIFPSHPVSRPLCTQTSSVRRTRAASPAAADAVRPGWGAGPAPLVSI